MERKELYTKNTANYLRLKTDIFFADCNNDFEYSGFIDKSIRYIEEFQLLKPELWKRFVQQFREDADKDAGWSGEFWGKMMRGACFVYSYTKNQELYKILMDTVNDIIDSQDDLGRISSYYIYHEFDGWDLWGRKYVLLGMQYFLEICTDEELCERIKVSMCRQVDYLIENIGAEEGKKQITSATRHWRGLNSSSILEPIVRLYNITNEERYFDFSTYIVNCGGTEVANIFDLAYENEFCPYQYPITKAYEMMSCFEGLLEYYRVTRIEKYKTAIKNFADRILETDFTVIGSCGCTHELFDHSTVRQANTTNGITAQETCVTVTLMKFLYQLTLLTGNSKYVDAFEKSMYNAYLGAINTEKVIEPMIVEMYSDKNIEPLPFDSYSPLTAGTRGNGIGGLRIMSDDNYYGCCACIGSAGCGLIPKMALLTTKKGFALNLFVNGSIKSKTPLGNEVVFNIKTDYPKSGEIVIEMQTEIESEFEILIRNPKWSKTTQIQINGVNSDVNEGYIALNRAWKANDVIRLTLDMRCEAIYPIPYGHEILMNKVIWGVNYMVATYDNEDPIAHKHIALRRGPIMLAQENRLGYSVDEPVDIKVVDGYVDIQFPQKDSAPYEHIIETVVPLTDGNSITVTDYASAGKLWTEKSKMAVWMLTK